MFKFGEAKVVIILGQNRSEAKVSCRYLNNGPLKSLAILICT